MTATSGRSSEPIPWNALAGITVLAALLRAIGLNNGMWLDELLALAQNFRAPIGHILTTYSGDNQHTLYALLAHASIGVFGEHAWSVRLPALIFGVASIPMLYAFARLAAPRAEALLASLLLAVAYHHVWYSQSARAYSLLGFLTLVSNWLLLRWLRSQRPALLAWFVTVSVLCVYAHLTMVFLVLGQALLCIAPARVSGLDVVSAASRRRILICAVLAGASTLLLYRTSLRFMYAYFVTHRPGSLDQLTLAWAAGQMVNGLRLALGGGIGLVAATSLGLLGVWSYWKHQRFVVGLLILPPFLLVIGDFVLRRPFFPRFFFFEAGLMVLVAVRGALELGRLVAGRRSSGAPAPTTIGVTIVGAMVAVSVVALVPNYRLPKQDYDGPLQRIAERRSPDEPVVTIGVTSDVYGQYYREAFAHIRALAELRAKQAEGRRVWIVYTFADHLATGSPRLMGVVQSECVVDSVYRGSMGGGDVTLCVMPPIAASSPR